MTYRLIIFVAMLAGLILSCASETTEIKVKVYGQGANFSGTYQIDDDDGSTSFRGDESTTDVYVYEETVEIENKLVLDVFPDATDNTEDSGDATDMTDLTCRVYDYNNSIIYEETYAISSVKMKTFTILLDEIYAE